MLQDRFRKKIRQPNGSYLSYEADSITDQIEIDDLLAEVDSAIRMANDLSTAPIERRQEYREPDRCRC